MENHVSFEKIESMLKRYRRSNPIKMWNVCEQWFEDLNLFYETKSEIRWWPN